MSRPEAVIDVRRSELTCLIGKWAGETFQPLGLSRGQFDQLKDHTANVDRLAQALVLAVDQAEEVAGYEGKVRAVSVFLRSDLNMGTVTAAVKRGGFRIRRVAIKRRT